MSTLDQRDIHHIFETLRGGRVPERGLDAFAVGVERPRAELRRQLDLAASGEGAIKFLRGGYGCGKTFMARLAVLDAQARGFATSFVVVSDNDFQLHRFDHIYHKVMTELSTPSCPRGALGDVLDRWIGRVEAAMEDAGADPDAPDFDAKVRDRLQTELQHRTEGKAPPDLVRVVQTIFELKQERATADAGALISWLSGSTNVGARLRARAGITGHIGSQDAMAYLRGILEIVKAAGHKGLVIVIDEAETILRMRKDTRHRSLNGLRQIADASGSYPGLLWVVTGTPDLFDSPRGVAGLAPLHDRVRFISQGGHVSSRQPQLELKPFDAARLHGVAVKLRELFPAEDRAHLDQRVTPAFLQRLVAEVTAGFKGDVGVVPRQFLRELVTVMDNVDESPDFVPELAFHFTPPADLAPEEARALGAPAAGAPGTDALAEDDGGLVPAVDVW